LENKCHMCFDIVADIKNFQ